MRSEYHEGVERRSKAVNYFCLTQIIPSGFPSNRVILFHCVLSLAAQYIVVGPVCLYVGLYVCLWVCYHNNSKLRSSIFTKLGL